MADDLKQRLRYASLDVAIEATTGPWEYSALYTEAKDRIEALEAEVERLQAEVVRMDGVVSTHKVTLAAEVAHADRLYHAAANADAQWWAADLDEAMRAHEARRAG